MSTHTGNGTYLVHLLGDDEHKEEVLHFLNDGLKASMAYVQRGVLAQRAAVLMFDDQLPDTSPDIIATYTPEEGAPVRRGAQFSWHLGDPVPAFPREQAAREDADETEQRRNLRKGNDDRRHAAYWYARGFIECVGPLSPFGEGDAVAFADWHVETANDGDRIRGITQQWAEWTAQRRKETGK